MTDWFDIERVYDDCGDGMGFYTEGHVDKEQFLKEVNEEWDEEFTIEAVKHMYMKFVKITKKDRELDCFPDEWDEYIKTNLEPKEGYSPITCLGEF